MSDVNLTVQEGSDVYLALTETPAVVSVSNPLVAAASFSVTVGTSVTVSNFPTTQVVSVSNFPVSSSVTIDGFSTSSLPPSTVTVGNTVTINGTVTANIGDGAGFIGDGIGTLHELFESSKLAVGVMPPISGTVTASLSSANLNSVTVGIRGSVTVANFPATQVVSVSNFPASSSVTIANFPATQVVSVSNFPSSSSVTIGGFSTSSLPPSTVTVANTVTVALDANSLSALENVTVTVGAAVTVAGFSTSSLPPSTVTVGNTVTISGTVTANVPLVDASLSFGVTQGIPVYLAGGKDGVVIDEINYVNNVLSLPPIYGTVTVGNFPATQVVSVSNFPASSSVTIANFPAVTTVAGTVALDSASLAALESVTVTIGAAVSISNFPTTQVVSVSNFPISSSVTIGSFSTSSLPPSTVTVANTVTISGTVTANAGDFASDYGQDQSPPNRSIAIGWGSDSFSLFQTTGEDAPLPVQIINGTLTPAIVPISGTVTVGNSVTIGSCVTHGVRLQDGSGNNLTSTSIGGVQRLNVSLASAATPGGSLPSFVNVYGGSDGSAVRTIAVDSSGRTVVTVANFPATQAVSLASTTVTVSNVAGFNIPTHDFKSFAYTGGNLTQIAYQTGGASGTTVGILTLAYDGSGNLTSMTRT